jgi:uncharacterized protein
MPRARRDQRTAGYFDALSEGRLAVLRCRSCLRWSPPAGFFSNPMIRCPGCGSAEIEWELTEGKGNIVSWAHDPTFPSIVDGTPGQTSALVELAEGPWVFAALRIEPEQLVSGLPVVVEAVIPFAGGEPVPCFCRAEPWEGES